MKKGKTRIINLRIDDDVLQWFRAEMRKAGGGSYQTAMNEALRRAMESSEGHVDEHSGPPSRPSHAGAKSRGRACPSAARG